jgi:hypothetical protein
MSKLSLIVLTSLAILSGAFLIFVPVPVEKPITCSENFKNNPVALKEVCGE